MKPCYSIILLNALSLMTAIVASAAPTTARTTTSGSPSFNRQSLLQPQGKAFQPGIWIDWQNAFVEAKATVIMRKGLIELAVCSPRIREHESILRLEAQPTHLYMALGLIGLNPGQPVRYDQQTAKLLPPTGDPLAINVRYVQNDILHEVPLENWLAPTSDSNSSTFPEIGRPLPWVFAGSVLTAAGGLAVDTEGTVVALVNFASALIAVGELHTDANESLWLKPNTPAIPPRGTQCVLTFRQAPGKIVLESTGRYRLNNRPATLADITQHLDQLSHQNFPNRHLTLAIEQNAPVWQADILKQLFSTSSAANVLIEASAPSPTTRTKPANSPPKSPSSKTGPIDSAPTTRPPKPTNTTGVHFATQPTDASKTRHTTPPTNTLGELHPKHNPSLFQESSNLMQKQNLTLSIPLPNLSTLTDNCRTNITQLLSRLESLHLALADYGDQLRFTAANAATTTRPDKTATTNRIHALELQGVTTPHLANTPTSCRTDAPATQPANAATTQPPRVR